jgi:hypothetical protein
MQIKEKDEQLNSSEEARHVLDEEVHRPPVWLIRDARIRNKKKQKHLKTIDSICGLRKFNILRSLSSEFSFVCSGFQNH